jgi:hypothetical protein
MISSNTLRERWREDEKMRNGRWREKMIFLFLIEMKRILIMGWSFLNPVTFATGF